MNKAKLIAQVAADAGLTKVQATRVVEATFRYIQAALRGGDEVRIAGFGNFQVSQRRASTGRNPRTGAAVEIPARRIPRFRAGKALKGAVVGPHGLGGHRDVTAFGRPHGAGGHPDEDDD